MENKDLFIRVYAKDIDEVIYPDKISSVNVSRQRVTLNHKKHKGDLLFDKCVVMRCTGLLAPKRGLVGESDQLVYEFDEVDIEDDDKNIIHKGRIVYVAALASFGIDVKGKIKALSGNIVVTSTDADIINYIKGKKESDDGKN